MPASLESSRCDDAIPKDGKVERTVDNIQAFYFIIVVIIIIISLSIYLSSFEKDCGRTG